MSADGRDRDDGDGVAFVIPNLGESVSEASIVHWLVRNGDRVARDQRIVCLSLDKLDVELEAPVDGVLVVSRPEQELVKVGETVARIVSSSPRDPERERQHDALLAAIAESPGDEGLRQVYTDFLLEAAAPLSGWSAETTALRAEYLRIEARLSEPGAKGDAALTARRDALISLAVATAASLVRVPGTPTVERGFVVGFETDLATLTASGEKLFASAPLRALGVNGVEGNRVAEVLLALPRLENLDTLRLAGALGEEVHDVVSIVASPRLANVRQLHLRALTIGARLIDALARSQLTSLHLNGCVFHGKTELLALTAALPASLEALVLRDVEAGDADAQTIGDQLRAATRASVRFL